MLFLLLPMSALAESVEFLDVTVTDVERSRVCPSLSACQSLFLILGKIFNSNGELGVKVGDEWAQVIRATNSFIVAVASQDVYAKTPVVESLYETDAVSTDDRPDV